MSKTIEIKQTSEIASQRTSTTMVEGKNFNSFSNLSELVNECFVEEYGNQITSQTIVLNCVKDTSKYRIGDRVRIDFDGNGSIVWNGEISGIFENEVMVYIY